MQYNFGWRPDYPDYRDLLYAAPQISLPPSVDLRSGCPAVYDQGDLGSCTANAIAGALQFDQIKEQSSNIFTPSRLFIYYNERALEHSIPYDSGAQIRDGVKSVAKQGACTEDRWPYNTSKFAIRPPGVCYIEAAEHKAVVYQRVPRTLAAMKSCLAEGYPFVFGFSVYSSFESDEVAKTGVVPMPVKDEELLGGHAVVAVGYDDYTQRFIVRNSWGDQWGMQGYFSMHYNYLMNHGLASDFWTIRSVEA